MSWSLRRVLVVLTAVAALGSAACLQTAFAQKTVTGVVALPVVPPQQPATGSADAASFDLPKDTTAHRRIEAAHDYIEAKRWEEVVKVLQDILDDPQDKFAPLPRKGPDGKEVVVPTSVRAEANRLLANLPKEGLEAYKAYGEAGPRADEYLKKSHDATTVEDRLALLGLVVRNYLHTDAGAEAADQLATHYMDLGDFRTAGRFFSLLLTRAGAADNLSPETLFRAAYAFNQAGDKADEDLIWQTAHSRGIREIRFGDETKSVGDLQDYLGNLAHAVDAVSRQWAYFLGDASHTGKGDGGPAFMVAGWRQPTYLSYLPPDTKANEDKATDIGKKIANLLDTAAKQLNQVNQPVIPSQFPVTATTVGKDGQKMSLVVYMTHAGIAAADMRTGKLKGRTPVKGTLDWMMQDAGREGQLNAWTQAFLGVAPQPGQRPDILFENTTIGTLSTDGQFVYAVEDLAVPPPPQYRLNMGAFPGGNPNPYGYPPEILEAVTRSRLLAFDLNGGCKDVWDVPAKDDVKSELAESCFLGPPLTVNGKLYVLAEKQQELRLICMENVPGERQGTWKPKVNFVLPLGTARDSNLHGDVLRRIDAGHLSYGEGVLVCPTNLGYVIAIDLLQNSLLWAYPYRDKNDVPEDAAVANPFGRRIFAGGVGFPGGVPAVSAPQQGWKVSAPIIQDGKVVFTAPDSKSIHCVRLKDGTPVWSKPRRQETDLYLGSVVNGKVIVVGKGLVHAYDLASGDDAWTVETGMPSGFGAASENTYYVPLKEAVGSKKPEICAIDVDRGIVTGHSKSRSVDGSDKKPESPGNLVFFDGHIISQTAEEVVVYPQAKVKKAEMTEKLKANPDDVDGLFDRGELSLEEGSLEDAVQDFLHVLKNNPPAEMQANARTKLYDALTEYFQHDFDQAEKYQNDYQALCAPELPPGAADQDRAEARRRWTNYLYLLAKGKEGQRKLTEAFDKYMELNAQAQPDELLSLVDERLVKAAPDVLAQGRIAAMVAGATEEERRPLEARIAARWKEIQSKNDLGELRKFVTLFGSLFTVGQEARLQLAERLMDDDKDASLIDAERQLSLLRARTQDPELAARAVECLARLNTRKGLLEDAAYYYRVLRDRYPAVKVRDGKTGADLFDEMATDKRLWSHLDDPPRFGAFGRLHAAEERDSFPYVKQAYKFSQVGEPLPFFQRYSLALEFANHELRLTDRTTGEARWKPLPITHTMFQSIATNNNLPLGYNPNLPPGFPGAGPVNTQPPPTPNFSFMSLGHLVVLPVGHMVFGVDAVAGKVLWEKNLFNPVNGPAVASVGAGPPVYNTLTVDPRDGSVQVVYQDGWTQRLGQTGPLEGAAVCLQMKDALTAIDPVSGRVLWTRSDVSPRSCIFGDDQHVFVVEMSPENKPAYTRVLRAYDGASVPHAPDFREAYENRIRLMGRNILVADKDKDATTLRLYDPLTGKDLWKQAFAPKSYVLQAEDGDLAGVVEPDGQVRVVDLATRKEVLNANSKMDPKYLEKDAVLSVLGDASDVYVACNGPLAANTKVFTNLMPGTGLRGLNVNGELYAFRRETGKTHWHVAAANTQLLLDRFQEMPMVVLTAVAAKYPVPFNGLPPAQTTLLTVVEKRTGKTMLPYGPAVPGDANHDPSRETYPGGNFHALEVDGRNGKIELTSPLEKISFTLESDRPVASPTTP